MEAETAGEGVQIFRALGELGEDFHFNGGEEGFGGPEGKASLQNLIGAGSGHNGRIPFLRSCEFARTGKSPAGRGCGKSWESE